MQKKLLIVTTVPETLLTILKSQPKSLASSFNIEIATSPDDGWQDIGTSEGVQVHPVKMLRGISVFSDFLSVLRMISVIRKAAPDIVHSYTPKAGLVAMAAAWVCRVPVRIHTFTGLIFPTQTGMKRRLLIWIDRLICFLATNVVPEGRGVRNDLVRYRVTGKELNLIGNGNIAGVDCQFFSKSSLDNQNSKDFESSLKLKRGEFRFCYIGRLSRDKGIVELVEAFMRLKGNAKLLLVGAEDVTAPIGVEVLSRISACPDIVQVGFLKDIRPPLACSDVLVLPSYREGFPNVLLQAGAMELPVIATNVNGSNEIVEQGVNGWLVPPKDIASLAKAMEMAMAAGSDGLSVMGKNGRHKITTLFERSSYLRELIKYYERQFVD